MIRALIFILIGVAILIFGAILAIGFLSACKMASSSETGDNRVIDTKNEQ